jgi:hypothetical protein
MKGQRIIIYFLLLQEFDSTILEKPRKQNVVTIFLSRLTNSANQEVVDDYFPYDHLFAI